MKYCLLFFLLMHFAFSGKSQTEYTQPPEWSKKVIWYQIMVERFHNADTTNDPKPDNILAINEGALPPQGWHITPWTQNWYRSDDWMLKNNLHFSHSLGYRRYGGDLQGVIDKLDYLSDLGITAIYLNPVNDAPSLHKYDARNYHHIDVNFGPTPNADQKLMATENPADATTWVWTNADKLFLKLITEAHNRNIKVIMDYSWNHTGTEFWAWKSIIEKQETSPYKDWYYIQSYDNLSTPQNEMHYKGWANLKGLPELKKSNINSTRQSGNPYEGDMPQPIKDHITDVCKRWLAPNGNTNDGVDGFRLDVADEIGLNFWRWYRKQVRNIKHDAYLVGEIWWQQWPDALMNPTPYLAGDLFDAVMFYQIYKPARDFFAGSSTAKQFKDSLQFQTGSLKHETQQAMMNVSSTHDTPRLLTCFYNNGKYKYNASPNADINYKTGKPDVETFKKVQLYLIHNFCNIGAPHIWNGDEMGMWGADDPYCRKPMMWLNMDFEPEYRNNFNGKTKDVDPVIFNKPHFLFYKTLCSIRNKSDALQNGKLEFIITDQKKLCYKRTTPNETIFVAINAGNKEELFTLPSGNFIDLITGKKYENSFTLNHLSGVILKLQ